MPLTDEELALAARIGFDPDILELVKQSSGKPIEQTTKVDDYGENVPADGISTLMSSDEVEVFLDRHQAELLNRSYRAFWSVRHLQNGMRAGDELVILKTTDDREIIRIRQTDGANYDIMNADILARLNEWSKLCQFEVVGAARDWVAMSFKTLPENICAFADDVYEFCPDTVEQGVGLEHESSNPEMFAAARRLCPDSMPKGETAVDKQQQLIDAIKAMNPSILDKFAPLLELMKNTPQTTSEMGTKLLAYEIQEKKYLFLWWD